MNKTVTINISGIIFHIDEDAYVNLNRYLAAIKTCFANTDEGQEVMGDIESRIAELLRERTGASKQVVTQSDVDYIIAVMGKPEDFAGENTSSAPHAPSREERIRKRLFRNPD